MSDPTDNDLQSLSDDALVNMPAAAFGDRHATSLMARIDRILLQSLSEQVESIYVLPLFRNQKLQRVRDHEEQDAARERERATDGHDRFYREERVEIAHFQFVMDEIIRDENELLRRAQELKAEIEQQSKELDSRTLMVDGRKVYLNGDHCVDEDGNRLNEQDEAKAREQLRLRPNAATWEQKQRIDELRVEAGETEQQIREHAGQSQRARDEAPAMTAEKRQQSEDEARRNRDSDKDRVRELGGKVGASAADAISNNLSFVTQPGGAGKSLNGAFAVAAPPLKELPAKDTGGKGSSFGEGAVAVGRAVSDLVIPLKSFDGDAIASTEKKETVERSSSYASTVLPTTGKGDLSDAFGTAIVATADKLPLPDTASAKATQDKSPLATEFAAVVTPKETLIPGNSNGNAMPAATLNSKQNILA